VLLTTRTGKGAIIILSDLGSTEFARNDTRRRRDTGRHYRIAGKRGKGKPVLSALLSTTRMKKIVAAFNRHGRPD
jgi:hypothetical protein